MRAVLVIGYVDDAPPIFFLEQQQRAWRFKRANGAPVISGHIVLKKIN
jgi:hypothetical protein